VGLRSYYNQFAGMSDEEITEQLKERSAEERRKALARVETLDLSQTTWHELPHPDVVAAITYVARGTLNLAADPTAEELRRELGRRNGIEPSRIAIGNGSAQLLASATRALLQPGHELLIPWPSYSLYPLMAQRAGARAVPVPHGHDVERLLAAVRPETRAIALCNPNDPTGAYLPPARLRELLDALPEHVSLLLDEALVDFVADDRAPSASLALLDDHPRLLVFRTFSKIYGLAGLRAGYVLGGPGSEQLLERIAPELGVSTPLQAGALEALQVCDAQVATRRAVVLAERARVRDGLHELALDAQPSEAHLLWLRAPGLSASELTARLRRGGVIVMSGEEVGDDEHVRATIQGPHHTDRLLAAARTAAL
jgi:histidinol-phosphate aminotransferase